MSQLTIDPQRQRLEERLADFDDPSRTTGS
jgi:hypothetical protein